MKRYLGILGMALGFCLSAVPAKAYTIWADDFESNSFRGGWSMNKVVYANGSLNTGDNNLAAGTVLGGYYPGTRFGPNDVVAGQGGIQQGNYSAKIWPDYDGYRSDWNNNNIVSVSLLRNHVITADDIAAGSTFQMDLNYKFQPTLGPSSGAFAFAGLFNSDFSANWWNDRQVLSTNGGNWSSAAVSLSLNSTHIGANMQFGVTVYAQNDSPNGLFVDNVTVSNVPEPTSASLLGLGLAGLLASRLRRRS